MDKNLEDEGFSWHNQNHSVLLIGWGEDKDTQKPFWIVRNSYGPTWGNDGDFMLRRGVDAFGVESDAVSIEPVLCSDTSTDKCLVV